MLTAEQKIKKILVVRNDRFGEFLLNIPAMRALKETFACARLTAVVNPAVRELAQMLPYIDEIIEWAPGRHGLKDKIRLIGRLRKEKFDLSVMLNPSRDFNLISFFAGVPIRAGYDRKLGFLLTHKIKDTKQLAQKHEVDYNLELVGLVGAKTRDKSLTLNIAQGNDQGRSAIVLHPWTSDPAKEWPLDNFRFLAERINRELGIKVVIVGGRENSLNSRTLFGASDSNLLDLTGKTSLRELAVLLKSCRLLVSADSGPMHLAACLKVPVLALFRNDIPAKSAKRWGPWGSGTVIEKASLRDISVEEVFRKVKEMSA
jgi:heptosyltransferase-2